MLANKKMYINVLAAVLLAGAIFMTGCEGPEGPAGPAGEGASWDNTVAQYEDCVYLIGFIPYGEEYAIHVGTGWAVSATQIITNAHVAYGIYDLSRDDFNSSLDKIVAIKNGTFTGRSATYELVECTVHSGYNNLNPFSSDFAIFTVDTTSMPDYVSLTTDLGFLKSVRVGQAVGTLGFPGELSTSDMDGYQPIATFKNGIISALRPFNQRQTAQNSDNNMVVQYNFSTTGGTSGSPVFLQNGRPIAINNSEIAAYVWDINDDLVRINLGDINFGIRLDNSSELLSMPNKVNVSDFRRTNPSYSSTLTSGQYRIVLDWNTSDDFDLWISVGETQYICGYVDESRAYIYPFVCHHGDSWSYGPERATVLQLTNEIKIFAVAYYYWSYFSTASATCAITSSSGSVANITNPPSGTLPIWMIGTISPTGNFTLINQLTDINPMTGESINTMQMIKDLNLTEKDRTVVKERKR